MSSTVVQQSIEVPPVLGAGITLYMKRIYPPRGVDWQVQRIRIAGILVTNQWYTAYNGVAINKVGPNVSGLVAGAWKNSFAPQNEIVWCPAVNSIPQVYDPQTPIHIGEEDILLIGAYCPFQVWNGLQAEIPPKATAQFWIDLDETLKVG